MHNFQGFGYSGNFLPEQNKVKGEYAQTHPVKNKRLWWQSAENKS